MTNNYHDFFHGCGSCRDWQQLGLVTVRCSFCICRLVYIQIGSFFRRKKDHVNGKLWLVAGKLGLNRMCAMS